MTLKHWLEEYIDWFLYPACMAFLPVMAIFEGWWSWVFAGLIVAGWVQGTFAEYVIHRWVLHGPYWMAIHQRHHEFPKENTRFPLWQIPSYFLAIYGLCYLAFGSPNHVAVFEGWIVWYFSFFGVHWVQHHRPEWIPNFAIRHNAHHKVTVCNYGVTIDFWDRVFGTFRQPKVRA